MNANHPAQFALELRRNIITMLEEAGSGHAGGALGMADVFAVLYTKILQYRPRQPRWTLRDRLLVSNGHICPVWYASLAQTGYFSPEILKTLRKIKSPLQGHPHETLDLGIEITSGPLGQGLSQGIGIGLGLRLQNNPAHTYVVMSDGEHQEGQTWEAYMAGAKFGASNVTALIDRNFIQISGVTEKVMPLESLSAKIQSFGWHVYEVNGHDYLAIEQALRNAKSDNEPSAILFYTEPGRGVDFMESRYTWHGAAPDEKQAQRALRQLQSLDGKLQTQYE